ncbi:MAG: dihydrofolate reductase family protein [Solirubrobacteraceae bacterium]
MPSLDDFLAPFALPRAVTVAVMVSSLDGRATIGGRVGRLTGSADQLVLATIREQAGAVVIGAGTHRTEGYGRLLDPKARERRLENGLREEPELVVLRRNGPGITDVWRELRERHPERLIVSEGGPTMLGVELENGLIDELVLAVSPTLIGARQESRVVEHATPLGTALEFLACATAGGFVFLRHRVLP